MTVINPTPCAHSEVASSSPAGKTPNAIQAQDQGIHPEPSLGERREHPTAAEYRVRKLPIKSFSSESPSRRAPFEEADASRISVNPFNFDYDIKMRDAEFESERCEAAVALFDSSIAAQENRIRGFEAAKLIHASPVTKAFLFAFGRSLAEILRKCYPGEEFDQKKDEMFQYCRDHQCGAVNVEDNLFLQNMGRKPHVGEDVTLRELGASFSQIVAIVEENKEFMRMLRRIANDPTLQEQLKQDVDIDFFHRLCEKCGCDNEDLPRIIDYHAKLYEGGNNSDLRTPAPEKYRVKEHLVSDLKLSSREEQFVGNRKTVSRATGGQYWRISPGTQFAENAAAKAGPTTAGPSGTTFYIILAAKLLAPSIASKLAMSKEKTDGMFGWKNYSAKLFIMTLMGYLHGEHEAEHHHSMDEVLQGAQRADDLISACYNRLTDNPEAEVFGFGKYKTEELLSEIFQRFQLRGEA